MAFCDFVKDIRDRDHLTQAQIADFLDVNINTIKQIEANKIKTPSNRVLDSICNYLNENRLSVITKILFRRDEIIKCEDDFIVSQAEVLSRYMSYLYLEGWNIDEAPVIYQTKDLGELTYAGQLTKKREPNNKIVVGSISESFNKEVQHISNDEAIYYITSSMAAFFCIDEIVLKGIHIVFDASVENQKNLFSIFKSLQLNKVPFNYQMVLFNPKEGQIIDAIELK
ncbi:helix-turn-helix domain-containing protein [[Eubacterium] hominis]|uniref:helix-turn-helix domain-containing protein n=1 Tax=[Eubacterium] hominis TaxID=2764325 RepID=UPI003A4DE1D7